METSTVYRPFKFEAQGPQELCCHSWDDPASRPGRGAAVRPQLKCFSSWSLGFLRHQTRRPNLTAQGTFILWHPGSLRSIMASLSSIHHRAGIQGMRSQGHRPQGPRFLHLEPWNSLCHRHCLLSPSRLCTESGSTSAQSPFLFPSPVLGWGKATWIALWHPCKRWQKCTISSKPMT